MNQSLVTNVVALSVLSKGRARGLLVAPARWRWHIARTISGVVAIGLVSVAVLGRRT